ncbi:TetR/AcrR family transcriptional regulator [Solicola gregarius]|uniref:TetR/AcrR family transcriptional regulator n=1 Tax=Solicola gregarius TaxID=2908642 RepID=A0AA46YLJ3_9ACTN|nr:TetR/AcrR family transcriptional regulator [Solicola gregarius]UYM05561.1 TetR/AcrR family transcriptional regulator [Solicola gregarius]
MTTAPSAPRTARAIAREQLTRAILDSARQQLAKVGPGQLSLRAVARELGMASSAVYRYFASRDELLTALIIEAYDELGTATERADAGVTRRSSYALRWEEACHAIRAWAVAHPHDYALLYGSPVPGYAAPTDTITPAFRVTRVITGIMIDASAAGVRPAAPQVPVSRRAHSTIAGLRELAEGALDDAAALAILRAWSVVIGTLTLELFGHIVGAVDDYDAYFEHVVKQLGVDLGLR